MFDWNRRMNHLPLKILTIKEKNIFTMKLLTIIHSSEVMNETIKKNEEKKRKNNDKNYSL